MLTLALALSACDTGDSDRPPQPQRPSAGKKAYVFPDAPRVARRPLDPRVGRAVSALFGSVLTGGLDGDHVETVERSDDARVAWFVSDLLRFAQASEEEDRLADAFERLTGVDVREDPSYRRSPWLSVTDHLIAWDLPAPPGYRALKARLYLALEPRWRPFFADRDAGIDWRLISWGGVFIDDRREGDSHPCERACIPALDDPKLIAADDGGWYPDERLVFGVVEGGEAVALPKNVMEVHEMVNLTVGGRRLGIPYCTLCGSAQAYRVDAVPRGIEPPLLRTSGLLSRSNKVMYDLRTTSVLDTFTGRALSGPLQAARVTLEQTTVEVSTWGDWKRAHPDTRIVAEDGGIGRTYEDEPLGGRDDDGPIFPVGDVDPRLPVQEQVVGVIAPDGEPVAFPAGQARSALADGAKVTAGGVELVTAGAGLRARTEGGKELTAHQAFWFAWSQFHPGTQLWTPRS